MRIILRQEFPLGRFHATPWRVNPFDDPYGEWPPSPWRFVRSVIARWYQWRRECGGDFNEGELDALVNALRSSRYAFYLPPLARRGVPLRQYFPSDFAWDPGEKKKAGLRGYKKSLAQDNFWCTAADEHGAVLWFIEGEHWSEEALKTLEQCLERITYFGRAETFTRFTRLSVDGVEPNCELYELPNSGAVPVLCPTAEATRADFERTTEDKEAVNRSIPPGAVFRYARIPGFMRPEERRGSISKAMPRQLIQLAIGSNVTPELRAVVRLTSRFRGAVLRELLALVTAGACSSWSRAGREVRERVSLMSGKDARGRPLEGHRHAEFFVWLEEGVPSRLLVWRSSGFDELEEKAILRAASRELSWAAPGDDSDAWKVRVVPLDRAVPPPAGFEGKRWRTWESVTPYVPPRRYLRGRKLRTREAIPCQVQRELALRGFVAAEGTQVSVLGSSWVSVHLPRRVSRGRAFWGDRRGFWLRLEFPEPVDGPLRLGHSASFGLGLFRPVE